MSITFNPRIRFVDDRGYLTREAAQMLGFTDVDQGFQPSDDTLTALAGLSATAGIIAQTGADAFSKRTLQAPAAGLTITNPAGTGGNPTFALANDLAGLEGVTGTGFSARTATDAWASRTLAAPAAGLTITNPAGVGGNPTFALANDLAALEGISGTGLAVRTATDTWTARTIAGTSPVSVANGDGVAGNPTVSLDFTVSAFAETFLDDADAATFRTTTGTNSATNLTTGTLPDARFSALANWTPVLTFATLGDLSVAYTTQEGRYQRIGNTVIAYYSIITSTFTHSTASGALEITGLPVTAVSNGAGSLQWQGITKANFTQMTPQAPVSSTKFRLTASGSGQSASSIVASDMPSGGTVRIIGYLAYEV